MSELVKNARKFKTWELLHSMTGWSKSHCKKVVTDDRNQETTAGKQIMKSFHELEKLLIK